MTGTNWTNISTFEGLLIEANRSAPFWTGIMFMLWVVLMITFLPFGTNVALLGSSFLAFVIGLFLVYMDLVAWNWLLVFVGVIILVIIVEALFSKKDQ